VGAAGAARVGRHDVVDLLTESALDVAARRGGRPPELFAGVDRAVIDLPVPYPSSCSPQAWSSASILLHLRSLLRLEPPTATDQPPSVHPVGRPPLRSLTGIIVGDRRFTVTSNDGSWVAALEPDAAGE
jgi:glycogen debranching enzyme